MDAETERVLVERLRQGDAAAFDAIHEAFNQRLFTFLLHLGRRRDVAEDLVDETWLRLVSHAHRLRPDTRIAPWLFTVARNLYASYVRSRLLEDSAVDSLMSLWPFSAPRSSPFDAAAANEFERRIRQALAGLPRASRDVLLLVAVAGLTHQEAASACGVSPEAFRQRLSRARARLSRALEEPPARQPGVLGEVIP